MRGMEIQWEVQKETNNGEETNESFRTNSDFLANNIAVTQGNKY